MRDRIGPKKRSASSKRCSRSIARAARRRTAARTPAPAVRRPDKALTYAQQALGIAPRSPDAQSLLVRSHLMQGDQAKAAADRRDPAEGLSELARALQPVRTHPAVEEGRRPERVRPTTRALALAPSNLEALAGVVRLDLRSGRRQGRRRTARCGRKDRNRCRRSPHAGAGLRERRGGGQGRNGVEARHRNGPRAACRHTACWAVSTRAEAARRGEGRSSKA